MSETLSCPSEAAEDTAGSPHILGQNPSMDQSLLVSENSGYVKYQVNNVNNERKKQGWNE